MNFLKARVYAKDIIVYSRKIVKTHKLTKNMFQDRIGNFRVY